MRQPFILFRNSTPVMAMRLIMVCINTTLDSELRSTLERGTGTKYNHTVPLVG